MIRYKILAALFSIIVAITEDFSLFAPDNPPSSKTEIDLTDWKSVHNTSTKIPETNPTIQVVASVYFPEASQTDDTPYITADGSKINKRNPKTHRWLAVSRDLHKRWGGTLNYGDSLWVSGVSDDLDGLYIVRDVMNKRMKKQIDILVGRKDRIMGLWKNVTIAKLD
jgi:3D (Asp-Asp-Asp) domain-containing protein